MSEVADGLLTAGKIVDTKWRHVHVGDIVEVHDNEDFPADLLCLHCQLEDGVCYIKTTNLDGTNCQARPQASPAVAWALMLIVSGMEMVMLLTHDESSCQQRPVLLQCSDDKKGN